MNKFRITYPNNKEVREYKSRTTKYHAYSYQASIGGSNFNDFDINDIMRWSKAYPEYNSMLYYNLPWTQYVSFKYPF